MRIVIISDAWYPQINGVVRTLTETIRYLQVFGHDVELIAPQSFKTIPCPTYNEIPLAVFPGRRLAKMLTAFVPQAIHIATEGPLGLAARRWCLKHDKAFTTAYHTQFPEYIHARSRIPLVLSYRCMRWFHQPSKNIMVPTLTVRKRLVAQGFERAVLWSRGVDLTVFYPGERNALQRYCRDDELDKPKFVYIGRVAVEKNIKAFLALDLPGSKWVIGDGPARKSLQAAYPDAHFLGAFAQHKLPPFYRAADVFVFPSLTDTFGLVLLEAMACGTPVAAFAVTGPIDVITDERAGVLGDDLKSACLRALALDRDTVANFAAHKSWKAASRQFESYLCPLQK